MLKIPVLLIVVLFLSATSATLAQCEVHEDAKLTASDAAVNDLFGASVSVSGDVTVVGAPLDDCAAGDFCGAAYVYRFNPGAPGQWVQEAKLTASDAAEGDLFSGSVAISGNVSVSVSGDVAVVGAPFDGSVYLYRFNGSTWVQEAKLANPDAQFDLFGGSVSVSGNVAVVGAGRDDCAAGYGCGSAYVYRFSGSAWTQQAKLTASDAADSDGFGSSVSVSGNVALVGAFFDDCAAGPNCGSAYAYRFNGSAWTEEVKLTASDAAADDAFGFSVSLSGAVAVVGALDDDCAAGPYCGSAYIYRFNGNTWVEEQKLAASDAAAVDTFGAFVSVSGDIAVVVAPRDDCGAGLDCGSAYVFSLADCNANSLPDGCEADCNSNGVPDDCDISSGTSPDCNANGIPDECEPSQICDADGDGVPDTDDVCPDSDVGLTIVIHGCNSGVSNRVTQDGCTLADLVAHCADHAANHGQFVSCVASLGKNWARNGMIGKNDIGPIVSCAAH